MKPFLPLILSSLLLLSGNLTFAQVQGSPSSTSTQSKAPAPIKNPKYVDVQLSDAVQRKNNFFAQIVTVLDTPELKEPNSVLVPNFKSVKTVKRGQDIRTLAIIQGCTVGRNGRCDVVGYFFMKDAGAEPVTLSVFNYTDPMGSVQLGNMPQEIARTLGTKAPLGSWFVGVHLYDKNAGIELIPNMTYEVMP